MLGHLQEIEQRLGTYTLNAIAAEFTASAF
jgi:hypothetical protein